MAELKLQRVPIPARGLDTSRRSAGVFPEYARDFTNAIVAPAGVLRPRGGITRTVTGLSTFGNPLGVWSADDYTISASGGASVLFNTHDNYVTGVVGLPGVGSATTSEFTTMTGVGVVTEAYGVLYSPGTPQQTVLVRCRPYGPTWTQIMNGPQSPTSVASYAERLFVLGGSPPGGGALYRNKLYYSDPGGPIADVLGEWQDDVTGLTNSIELDGPVDDRPVKLIAFERALYILRQRSIYRLTGSGPSTFSVTRVANIGCVSNQFACAHDNGIVFLSDDGFYLFDGDRAVNISGSIPTDVRNIMSTVDTYRTPVSQAPVGIAPNCSLSQLGPNHVILNYRTDPFASSVTLLYDVQSGTWSYVTIAAGLSASSNVGGIARTAKGFFLLGGTNGDLYDINRLAKPYDSSDFYDIDGATIRTVPMSMQTGLIGLGTPSLRSQVHRLMFDYTFNGSATTTLVATVKDGSGNTLSTHSLPQSPTEQRTRYVVDAFYEVTDVSISFVLTGGTTSEPTRVAVEDTWIEYQPAAQRRATGP